jgi:hypothetical protein
MLYLVATLLPARHFAAVVAFHRCGDGTAAIALARANADSTGAHTDCRIVIPPVAAAALILIPVAAWSYVEFDLGHLKVVGFCRHGTHRQWRRRENDSGRRNRESDLRHDIFSLSCLI